MAFIWHLYGYKLVSENSIESRLNFLRAFRSTFAPDLNQSYFRAIFTLVNKNKITNKQRIIAKLSKVRSVSLCYGGTRERTPPATKLVDPKTLAN